VYLYYKVSYIYYFSKYLKKFPFVLNAYSAFAKKCTKLTIDIQLESIVKDSLLISKMQRLHSAYYTVLEKSKRLKCLRIL